MANKIDLVEYAGRSVDFVKHSGDTYFAVCPFHSEKTASLAVTPTIYHCFGCGKFGNLYTWLQDTENLTFDQAVKKVANLTNSDIQDYVECESLNFYKLLNRLSKPKKAATVERSILDIDKDYRQRFKNEIPQEWVDEGISPEEMRKYEIMIDPVSNRIVYPVRDADFNLIGVKGRTRFKDYKALGIAKYMNFNKISTLDYFTGMMQAADSIKKSGEIIIVEGLKSAMKLDQWGFHNVVSAETSSLSDQQIALLIKMQVKNVVIAFDKDVNIQKVRGCVGLLNRFTNCYAVIDKWKLLDEKDSPCDKGEDVWRTLYERRIKI